MARVEIEVNGRPYTVGCEDGQEDKLRRLAARFDAEVTDLADQIGQIGDLRLFLMAGLVMCDALESAERRLAAADGAQPPEPQADPARDAQQREAAIREAEAMAQTRAASVLLRMAARIDALAVQAEAAADPDRIDDAPLFLSDDDQAS